MTFRPMASLNDRKHRLSEAGRIRLGQQVPTKNGKLRPDKLHTLRFTSPSQYSIEEIAKLYGGVPQPWNGEWEVVTEAAEVPIVLPTDDPLGDTPTYELWTKGGLSRRCDGETAVCPKRVSDDEVAMEQVPCICNERQAAECKVTVRLSVILPDIAFGGTWRVETHSWNAAEELPGMVEAIRAFTQRGFVKAYFGIRLEEKMEAGKKKEFIVPTLRLDASVTEVLAGGAALAAIPAGPEPLAIEGPEMVTSIEAKRALLAACDGDRERALGLWGDRERNPIPRSELDGLLVLASMADEVVDAEVVDDEGRPF